MIATALWLLTAACGEALDATWDATNALCYLPAEEIFKYPWDARVHCTDRGMQIASMEKENQFNGFISAVERGGK